MLVRVIELEPSITAASAPVAVMVAPEMVITPVEYMPGESTPEVTIVPPVTVMVPLPRSVAIAAPFLPAVVMSTLVRMSVPPSVASTPWPPSAWHLMVTSVRVTVVPVPVEKTPLAPVPLVVTVPPLMVMVLPPVANTPAFNP